MAQLVPGPRVGVVDDGDAVYVAPLPDGPILVLRDVSALAWRGVCAADVDEMVRRVAQATGEAVADIDADLRAFVDELRARGLLVPAAG